MKKSFEHVYSALPGRCTIVDIKKIECVCICAPAPVQLLSVYKLHMDEDGSGNCELNIHFIRLLKPKSTPALFHRNEFGTTCCHAIRIMRMGRMGGQRSRRHCGSGSNASSHSSHSPPLRIGHKCYNSSSLPVVPPSIGLWWFLSLLDLLVFCIQLGSACMF
jgi:hypothetical protein